ncbi:hypothetical protein SKAU_G00197550 [Synaphobranchus kaupii]|uniref:Reverse transcriptase domain-containing protein n=1 Tax=Synaphobranchus kaupii TaxID=118154 RepID=A0A9Q1FEX1_SYNKA|nr:hypothetical protein SKAU_G00197550 [Synaphobranchus kaupii]
MAGTLPSTTLTLGGSLQGCVLSPLLFILYNNDCKSAHTNYHIVKFAEDTVLLSLLSAQTQDHGPELTSDSEHHDKESKVNDVMKSQKQTKETEQARILKIQMEFHEKQAEGNLISARISEHALAAERKENAILRQKRLAQEKVEQHVKEIKSGGPKEEIRNFKKKILEINEKHEKTQSGLKKQIALHQKKAEENWVVAYAPERALAIKRKEVARLCKQRSEASAKVVGYQEPLTEAFLSRCDLQIRPLRKYGAAPKKNVNTVDKSGQRSGRGGTDTNGCRNPGTDLEDEVDEELEKSQCCYMAQEHSADGGGPYSNGWAQALTLKMRVMEEELKKSQCCYMAQMKASEQLLEAERKTIVAFKIRWLRSTPK